MKTILFLVGFIFLCATTFGQWLNSKPTHSVIEHGALYVVDSIPIRYVDNYYTMPSDQIDHINIVKGRDSLKVEELGKVAYFDSIVYIFTKKYTNRPDSVKKIPSSRQMEWSNKDAAWILRGTPYTGKYIDYYDNGQKQSEGVLLGGRSNGDYLVYYQDGKLAERSKYFSKDNTTDYTYSDSVFYLNGSLYRTGLKSKMINGNSFIVEKKYFLNGQLSEYSFLINDSASGVINVDTLRRFNSYGNLIESLITDTAKYKTMMERIKIDRIKMANGKHINTYKQKSDNAVVKLNSKLIKSDSTSASAYLKIGKAELRQLKYNAAISYFDKALHFEPFLLEASLHRAYARIKRDEYEIIMNKNDAQGDGSPLISFGSKKLSAFLKNKFEISDKEREIICNDLQRAEQYPENFPLREDYLREDYYGFITRSLLQYCNIKSNKFPVFGYKIYL